MKLCILVEGNSVIPPVRGEGVGRVVMLLAKGLAKRGHQISVICGKAGDHSELGHIRLYKLKKTRVLGTKLNELLYTIQALIFLLVNGKKFDLVCFHACQLNYPILAYLFKILSKRPLVYSTHMAYPWDLDYEEIPLMGRLSMRLRAYCKRKLDKVIAPSFRIKQHVTEYTGLEPSRIEVIYHGMDIDLFNPTYVKEARYTLGLSDDDLVILFVGRLADAKGVEYLLRAVPIVLKEIDIARFVLVGAESSGGDTIPQRWTALCRELKIEDQVVFTGALEHTTLAKLYPSADIFLLPTLMECLSGAVCEALASGLPVVSTNTGDTALLIQQCGIVVKKRNEVDIANAIIKLAKNKELRKRYSNKALEVARKELSVERFIDEYEGVFTECLGN